MRHELLTEQELADLREIDVLLDEANRHSLEGDGHCKSSEGYVSIGFGNHWERHPDEPRKPVTVEIYSYLLGPHRTHYFDSTGQALEVVRQWHRDEMAFDYATSEHAPGYEPGPDLYLEVERSRRAEMDAAMRRFESAIESGEVAIFSGGDLLAEVHEKEVPGGYHKND